MATGWNYTRPYFSEIEFSPEDADISQLGFARVPKNHRVLRTYQYDELKEIKGELLARQLLSTAPSGAERMLVLDR